MFTWTPLRYSMPTAMMHQNKVIHRMREKGVRSLGNGICFGLTEMFIHACHFNRLHPFYRNLRAIKDNLPLSPDEEDFLFNGIQYYQFPWLHKDKLQSNSRYLYDFQEARLADQLFFKSQKSPEMITTPLMTCIYTGNEPEILINNMVKALSDYPFSIGFTMRNHKFAIHYNNQKMHWYWFEPNHISTKPLSTQAVIEILLKYDTNTVIRASLAISNKDQLPVEQKIIDFDDSPLWKKLLPIGDHVWPFLTQDPGGLYPELIVGNDIKTMKQVLSYLKNKGDLPKIILDSINTSSHYPPLHLAVLMGHKEMVQLILSYPYTNIRKLDSKGKMAIQIAEEIMIESNNRTLYDLLLCNHQQRGLLGCVSKGPGIA